MTRIHLDRASPHPLHTRHCPWFFAVTLILGVALAAALWAAQPAPAAAASVVQSCVPMVRSVGNVPIRFGPGPQYRPPIGTLRPGQQARVTGRLRNNSWYRIVFNGQEGWVFRAFVRTTCINNAPVVPPLPVNEPCFRADAYLVAPGQCTTLRWNINNVAAVFLVSNGAVQGVGGNDARVVCPTGTTTYILRVQRRDGTTFDTPLTITVAAATPIAQPNFRADQPTISPGQCTTLRWNVDNVNAVFFWDGDVRQGVGGNDSRQVCPTTTTRYRLQVFPRTGGSTDYFVTVVVTGAPAPGITFTVDSGDIVRGQCTNLRWNVTGAFNAVFLLDSSANTTTQVGASAVISVCPQVNATYTLRVIGVDGRQFDRSLSVNVAQGPTPVPPPTPMP